MDGSDFSSRIVEAAVSLRSSYPDARIAVIADRFDVRIIQHARDAGVNGSCRSACSREVFIKSHEPVMLGEVVLPNRGAPNKLIARRLDVAETTVKAPIKAILRKIGAANRTQAALWAATHKPRGVGASLRT